MVKEVYFSVFSDEKGLNPEKMPSYLTLVVGDKPVKQITVKTRKALIKIFSPEFKENIIKMIKNFFGFNNIKDKCLMYSLPETHSNKHQWAMYSDGGK